jgi:hypothetical protein
MTRAWGGESVNATDYLGEGADIRLFEKSILLLGGKSL